MKYMEDPLDKKLIYTDLWTITIAVKDIRIRKKIKSCYHSLRWRFFEPHRKPDKLMPYLYQIPHRLMFIDTETFQTTQDGFAKYKGSTDPSLLPPILIFNSSEKDVSLSPPVYSIDDIQDDAIANHIYTTAEKVIQSNQSPSITVKPKNAYDNFRIGLLMKSMDYGIWLRNIRYLVKYRIRTTNGAK